MSEFKFSCPQCGQHIQCDIGYAGAQIACPTCQQAITVPQMSADAPPPALPPPPPSGRPGASAPIAQQRFAGAPPAANAKSHTLRNGLVIAACVVVLAGLAMGGWMGYSKYEAKLALKKGNPAAIVIPPTAAQNSQALEIIAKVQNAYTNLSSLTASGTSIMALDMSRITTADINPKAKKTAKSRRTANFPKAITNTMEISIKLSRPNLYCVEENSRMIMGPMTMTNRMAAWSPGQTNYSLLLMNGGTFKMYTTSKNREVAVMAGGQPSMLVLGMLQLFFDDSGKSDKLIQDLGQTEDDSVNGQDCYTLTAKIFGQKLKMWVSKDNYMILRSQLTMGAPVSDADIDAAFAATDTSTNAAEIAKQKAQAKQQMGMMTKIRGTITDTLDDIEPNSTLTADDFNYPVPRGTRLVPRQF